MRKQQICGLNQTSWLAGHPEVSFLVSHTISNPPTRNHFAMPDFPGLHHQVGKLESVKPAQSKGLTMWRFGEKVTGRLAQKPTLLASVARLWKAGRLFFIFINLSKNRIGGKCCGDTCIDDSLELPNTLR